jgi:hypothetical protein
MNCSTHHHFLQDKIHNWRWSKGSRKSFFRTQISLNFCSFFTCALLYILNCNDENANFMKVVSIRRYNAKVLVILIYIYCIYIRY